MGRGGTIKGGVSSSTKSASGTYTNYYKADKDAKSNPTAYKQASGLISQALNSIGKPASWQQPLEELVARESSFNSKAANPKSSAKGYFQFLDGTRKNYGGNSVDWSDPYTQVTKGIQYVIDRYGTPEDALRFWDKNGWY